MRHAYIPTAPLGPTSQSAKVMSVLRHEAVTRLSRNVCLSNASSCTVYQASFR